MAFEFGSIFSVFSLDTRPFHKGAASVEQRSKKLATTVSKTLTGVGPSLQKMIVAPVQDLASKVQKTIERIGPSIQKTVSAPVKQLSTAATAFGASLSGAATGGTAQVLGTGATAASKLAEKLDVIAKSVAGLSGAGAGTFRGLGRVVDAEFRVIGNKTTELLTTTQQIAPQLTKSASAFTTFSAKAGEFARGAGAKTATLFGTMRQAASEVTKELGVPALRAVKKFGATFREQGAKVVGGLGRIGRGIANQVLSPLKNLVKQLISLGPLIAAVGAAFGTATLIQRAKSVDSLSRAFVTLQGSIGAVASESLEKLRKATKNTVSDLNLMRVANQAVILGIELSADEFAELAEAAKSLGSAVGRTTLQALEDLTQGIGTQNQRQLNNLQVVVRAEEAYRRLARTLGVTVNQLTRTEKRVAFTDAALEEVRKRLRDLPQDIETVADRFGALSAAFSNVVTTFAQELIDGAFAKRIATFLRDLQPALRKLGVTIRALGSSALDALEKVINRIQSQEFSKTLNDIQETVFKVVGSTLRILVGLAVDALVDIIPTFLPILLRQFGKLVLAVAEAATRAVAPVVNKIIDAANVLLPGGSEIDPITGFEISRLFNSEGNKALLGFQQKELEKVFGAIKGVGVKTAEALNEEQRRIRQELALTNNSMLPFFDIFTNIDAFRDKTVRGLLTDLEKTPALIRQLKVEADSLRRFNETFDLAADSIRGLNDALNPARNFTSFVGITDRVREDLNDAISQSGRADPQNRDAFADIIGGLGEQLTSLEGLDPFKTRIQELNREIGKFGLTAAQLAQADLDEQFVLAAQAIQRTLGPGEAAERQIEALRLGYLDLKEAQDQFDGAVAFFDLTKDVTSSLLTGIVDAFKEGESVAKVWAKVAGQFFEKSLNDAIDRISSGIGGLLTDLFSKAGLGAGGAAVAAGLVGIAGAILSNLEGQSSSSVDDFNSAIDSTEAVRGVVVGPTDVAISEVGSALKTALRQLEIFAEQQVILLGRIAADGGGGGGGSDIGQAFLLSSSTPS